MIMSVPGNTPTTTTGAGTGILPLNSHRDPWHLNVDLHCHSTVSDGTLAPREVVRRAWRNGVQAMALTDHDEVSGLADAARRSGRLWACASFPASRFPSVGPVKPSMSWACESIRAMPHWSQGLAAVRAGRDSRAHEMAAGLARAGIAGRLRGGPQVRRQPQAHLTQSLRPLPGGHRGLCRHPAGVQFASW